MIRRALTIVFVALLLGVGFLLYWSADANRFKPELQSLLSDQSGIGVTIQGDLSWKLFPPLRLNAESITAVNDDQRWSVGTLALELDVMTVIRTRDVDQWRVQALHLSDVVMLEDGDRLRIHQLELKDFSRDKPSPLSAALDYTAQYDSPDSAAIPLTLTTLVTYHTDPLRIEFTNGEFTTDAAAGNCNLSVVPVEDSGDLPQSTDADLVSVSGLRSFDWDGECDLDRLSILDQQFKQGVVTLTNKAAVADSKLQLPDFFGGRAELRVVTNASNTPVRWHVTPTLDGVDSERLMAWLDQRLQWMAALAYGGSIDLTGNTQAELLASVAGESTFDGGRGTIAITKLKEPLLRIATLLKESERISRWPDLWEYQRLTGNWRVQGADHALDFALDNLTVAAKGRYDVLADEIDMLAELEFATLADGQMFDVNPLLMDLPIPIRCVGSLDSPTCALVADAAQRIVAKVLTSDDNSALRAKIDEKIEKEVPEEYRDAARGLLDLLGGALERSPAKESSTEEN
jgi:hypothetical protein